MYFYLQRDLVQVTRVYEFIRYDECSTHCLMNSASRQLSSDQYPYLYPIGNLESKRPALRCGINSLNPEFFIYIYIYIYIHKFRSVISHEKA